MSCAMKIGQSVTAGAMPAGLIVREAKWLIGEGPCQPAKNSRSTECQDIVRNGLADSEHTDPEYVWGDEGPVNDQLAAST